MPNLMMFVIIISTLLVWWFDHNRLNKQVSTGSEHEQKMLELERTHEEDEITRLMLDATPLGVNCWTPDFRNIGCNEEAVKLFEVSSKEEYLERFFDLSPEYQPNGRLSREIAFELVNKAFETGYERFEWTHQKLSGEIVPCEIILVRVSHKDGYMVLGYMRDLTELKAMIREMEIAQDDLRQAWNEAEKSNRAKGQFLATVSHEIRTPMNVILGITEMQLHDGLLTPEVREAFTKIHSSGDMLLRIINDLLDLSKIEAGKLELIPVRFDVGSLINDAINLNVMRIDQKLIDFKIIIDENVPAELHGDELRIKQILSNLLSNAFKYTEKGEVKLVITRETSEEEGKVYIVFNVSDTGQGMNEEQLAQIFDEYTRFNMEANRTTVGTGIGMTITSNLVRLMGGTISVESEVGKGSTFIVRLPQELVGVAILGRQMAEKLSHFQGSTIPGKREKVVRELMPYGRVLIVDDMATNIDVARLLLKPYGLTIDTALSGFEAIDKVESGEEYSIIFMDHMMPKMDGIETAQKIRGMGYELPIVALTANAVVGQAEVFLQNGFDAFISKPIDMRQLNDVLNRLIRDRYDGNAEE